MSPQVLMTRPREEWFADVHSRYKALGQFSKEDARLQFLRILRSLPYGGWWGVMGGSTQSVVCVCSG
jgi:hypothetical protein